MFWKIPVRRAQGQFSVFVHKIVTGDTSADDLPTKKIKTFVHISLCRSIKAITKNVKYFKDERKFIKYTINLLANSCTLADVFDLLSIRGSDILEYLFKVLPKFSGVYVDAKNYMDEMAQSDIEKFKEQKDQPTHVGSNRIGRNRN